MNIYLIIDALETAVKNYQEELHGIEYELENNPRLVYCADTVQAVHDDLVKATNALAEARKMKEPCEMIELLSEYAHDAWAGWMRYLFSKSTINADGTVTIPKWAVERWRRQIGTKYSDLSDSEKMSDRKEAETILSIVQKLKEPCVWFKDRRGNQHSGCGNPGCAEMMVCPYCGRKVKYED